jgi:hypothetical protein
MRVYIRLLGLKFPASGTKVACLSGKDEHITTVTAKETSGRRRHTSRIDNYKG